MLLRGISITFVLVISIATLALLKTNAVLAPPSQPNSEETHATSPLQLDILAEVGPWPVASRLIGYQGRLWFANSIKGRNHISADIWSLDPVSGEKRYERNLFSQDAGVPLVYRGLLYWPFEDALLSSGNGVIEVTDGEAWQPLLIPNAPIYHSSQMLDWQGDLLTITGTRNAGMQLSKDSGRNWEELYIHPTPSTHVSRLKEMLVFKGKAYVSLKDTKTKRLSVWTGSGFKTINSWPPNRYFNGLTIHRNNIFGIVGRGNKREIWKFDGIKSVKIGRTGPFTDLTSDGEQLWIVSRTGALWSSSKGDSWLRHGDLKNGRPISIEAIAGGIYAAGKGDDGRGIVWGPRGHPIPKGPKPPAVIKQIQPAQGKTDWNAAGDQLDRLLSKASSYERRGNGQLRELISQAVESGAPEGFFEARLKAILPAGAVGAFGGSIQLQTEDMGRIMLLRAMAQSGHPNVPTDYLSKPWTAAANSYEKYFDPQLAALRAIAVAGQNDAVTINALIARLDFAGDPQWLKSQVIGTLTAVSGQHFGYDIPAWKRWARAR